MIKKKILNVENSNSFNFDLFKENRKVVLILNWGSYDKNSTSPDFKNDKYRKSYEQLYSYAYDNDLIFVKSHYLAFNGDDFNTAWTYIPKTKKWVKLHNIKPNLILDKAKNFDESVEYKKKICEKYSLLNNLEMTLLLSDKKKQSDLFFDYLPKSFIIEDNVDNFDFSKLDFISTQKVVLKPFCGSGGNGIKIVDKSDLKSNIGDFSNYIVQEFIDTSKGISNLITGVHDLRLIILNGEIVSCFIRYIDENSSSNSLLCNVNQGAKIKFVNLKQIPECIKKVFFKIDDKLIHFGNRFYSVDFFVHNKTKPYLVELNLSPGFFFYQNNKSVRDYFLEKLVCYIKKMII
jgi:glutathione synthase/RimK-type ligase-like ATP-grasp enzyme